MSKTKKTEYEVLIGCNVGCDDENPEGKRYEVGDKIKADKLTPAQIKALVELGCIEG